jgi:magnesium transporter
MVDEKLTIEDLKEAWPVLSADERAEGLHDLPHGVAQQYFVNLSAADQAQFLVEISPVERLSWFRQLPPDDAADLLQAAEPELRRELLAAVDDRSRSELVALLAYAEDDAGGRMSPRYARLRPDMTVDEAIHYLRRQATLKLETLYYAYVLDPTERLIGVVSLHELFAAKGERKVAEVMRTELVKVRDDADQEGVARTIVEADLLAVPVVDAEGHMRGIVTFDDVADVLREENTEDIQKLAAVEVLGAPYLRVSIPAMVKKRGGWLAILFVSEMLTTSAMVGYQDEIQRAVMLSTFVPLIISAGGNSGSQATTLVIRALALGELRPHDFLRVLRREIAVGLMLGGMLGLLGMLRIGAWQGLFSSYGEHWMLVGAVVFISVLGVVAWGSLVGALLPFVLRRIGLDPASASAPFVATLVDVSGVVIYFNVAWLLLRGSLL